MLFLDGRVGIYLFIYFFSFLKSMTIRKRKFEGRIIEVLNRFSFSIRRFPHLIAPFPVRLSVTGIVIGMLLNLILILSFSFSF